jgi:antitoxin PrlF
MSTLLTSKCQVTIPKKVRDTAGLMPGNAVEFEVEPDGRILLRKLGIKTVATNTPETTRFEQVRGKATIKWRTDDLMALLRGEND